MFQNMDLSKDVKMPRTKTYEKTLRFELPTYLTTAPDYLLDLAHRLKFLSFKSNTKIYTRKIQYAMHSNSMPSLLLYILKRMIPQC